MNLARDRYRLGIDSYLNVITAQTTLLANQRTELNLQVEQITDSVQLIEDLGGGWDGALTATMVKPVMRAFARASPSHPHPH